MRSSKMGGRMEAASLAKAIPKKGKKKKLSPQAHERAIKRMLADFDAETDARYDWAMKFLKKQDESVQEAVDRLVARMKEMAGRPSVRLSIEGEKGAVTVNLEEMVQERNFIYIAVRLLIAAAGMDIRISKFKFPKRCATPLCGRKV